MLNNKPIFLNCFSRGGSNILWNMFLSHPDVCSPIKETLEIFRFDKRKLTYAGWQVIWLSRQLRLFDQWYLRPRRPVSSRTQQFIDQTFFQWKQKTFHEAEMKYKNSRETYSLDEVNQARLVAKNNNGLVFLTDMFQGMYPDATFVALVRDPVALYESYKRRNIIRSESHFVDYYEKIVDRMLSDQQRFPRYHILRFEDMLNDPVSTIKQLCQWADLDYSQIKQVRFKAKSHLQADGKHYSTYAVGQHYWFDLTQLHKILEPQINDFQVSQLNTEEMQSLNRQMEHFREKLGYAKN